MSRTEQQRISDILGAIEAIERHNQLVLASASNDLVVAAAIDGITYQLIVIGEAVKALTPTFTARHPNVPWSDIAQMRDLITHHYHRVEVEVVRSTVAEPLAQLKAALTSESSN